MNPITEKSTLEEVAAVVSEALTRAGVNAVLSGGGAVSIYSANEYESYDLDFVTPAGLGDIEKVMQGLGFERKSGRHFVHPKCKFFVEFPASPLAIGDEPIKEWAQLQTKAGLIQILTPTQCVMDRLANFYHWNDRQCLDQAILVATRHRVDLRKIREWSEREGHTERHSEFEARVRGRGS